MKTLIATVLFLCSLVFTCFAKNESRACATKKNGFVVSHNELSGDVERNLYILSIGPDVSKQLLTEKDAHKFKNLFSGQKHKLYTQIQSDVLTGKGAYALNISKKILELSQKPFTENDIVLVFISGHTYVKDGALRLTGTDFQTTLPERTSLNLVNEVIQPLTALPCKVVFMLDINQGGLLSNSSVVTDTAIAKGISISQSLAKIGASRKNFSILTATSGNEISQEDPAWGGGAFIKALDESLSDGKADADKNGIITLQEIFNYSATRLPALVKEAAKKNYNGDLISQNPYLIQFTNDIPLYIN